jgi:signal transduction histidine kinase
VAIAGLQTYSSVQQALALQQFSRQVGVARQVAGLIHDIQRERDHTVGELAMVGLAGDRGTLDQQRIDNDLAADRRAVDKAVEDLRRVAVPLLRDTSVRATYDRAMAAVAEMGRARVGIRDGWLRQRAAFDVYSACVRSLLALVPEPSAVNGDPQLTHAVRAFADLAAAKELSSQVRGRLYAVFESDLFSATDFDDYTDARANRASAMDRFRADADPSEVASFDELVRGQAVRTAGRLEETAVQRSRSPKIGVDPQQWWQASTTQLELMHKVEQDLIGAAARLADARSATQWRRTGVVTGIVVAILIVALLTSWAIGRSMARALRTLRVEALDVAQNRLPEAIERLRTTNRGDIGGEVLTATARSDDEIGEVAQAFAAVHRSAVRLAAEQARMRRAVNAMFVNLARRSQSLVERQLQLLDGLEAGETDPDQLAVLFKLDHLATRMRRNDENLLVLAGGDGSRRWTEPVALSQVVLAAMAEIEQYQRIQHDVGQDVHVVGHAVADVVHLLAELLENATAFSPPDSVVTVSGWRSPDDTSAVITVEDRGIGMSQTALAEANQRLSTPMAIDVAASERMGLVVVGHLAARHRIRVDLRGSAEGVVAHVMLPAQLLAAAAARRPGALGPGRIESPVELPGLSRISTVVRRPVAITAGASPASRSPSPPVIELHVSEPVPVSAPPVSAPPVSAPPVSAPPVSAPPVSAPPVSAPPATAPPSGGMPRAGRPGPAGGSAPRRAEDVLAGGRDKLSAGTRWWSRGGPADQPSNLGNPVIAGPRTPVIGGTSNAGLPIRVPMAQLPGDKSETVRLAEPAVTPHVEPDPATVGSVLAQFYSGVHRAVAEESTSHG